MVYGDSPYVIYGGDPEFVNDIFYSDEGISLVIPITIPAGYGTLPAGTVLGRISESTNRLNQYAPYAFERPPLGGNPAAAYLVADGAASTSVFIKLEDSYRFAVGDHLAAADNTNYAAAGNGASDLGAITAIDRTTYSHMAKLTVSSNVGADHTVVLGACVFIQTTTAAPFTKAVGVLKDAVETGVGENAKPALANIVLSNCILYKGYLGNYDAEALTDLAGSELGQYLILK